MRNLKKVLALVLTLAMMLSVMVMNTGAVFSDASDINAKHTEAVDQCVALKIINGFDNKDGTFAFQPNGNVTRAQMCKMCCVAMNGGKEPALGTAAASSFTDVATSYWASPYIESCVAQGIVAGIGGGKFNPDGQVTGTQAAKMLLIALGYDATAEGLVGSGWDVKTNVLATKTGLYADLEDIDVSAALSREHAAQMIWNTLQADEVEYDFALSTDANGNLVSTPKVTKTGDTAMEDWYEGNSVEGTLTAASYNADKEEWTYTVNGNPFTTDQNYCDLYQQKVKVTYTGTLPNVDDTLGIVSIADVIFEAPVADMDDVATDDTEVTVDDVDYKLDKAVNGTAPVYEYLNNKVATSTVATLSTTDAADPFVVRAIDNNDDGRIDCFVVFPFSVKEVTYVGADTFQAGAPYDFDDVEVYDGIAKDDWAIVYAAANSDIDKAVFEKADIVSGEVTVINDGDYTINGEVYTLAAGVSDSALALTNEVDAVVVNGYIYNAEKTSGGISVDDVLYVNGVDVSESFGQPSVTARVVFADGSTEEVNVTNVLGNDLFSGKAWNKTTTEMGSTDAGVKKWVNDNLKDGLWAFEVDDGDYELSKIVAGTDKDFDVCYDDASLSGSDSTIKTGDDRLAGQRVNDDAVVFVVDKDGDVSVIDGATVAGWAKDSQKKAASIVAYANENSGYNYVELAAINMKAGEEVPGSSGDDVYGYVVKALGQSKEDGTQYTSFSVWTGAANETIKVKSTDVNNDNGTVAKGSFVKVSDGKISVVGTAAAVKANDADSVQMYKMPDRIDEFNITDDTQIIYVNTKDVKGVEGGSIAVADDMNTVKNFESNVVYVQDADDAEDLAVLFVDVNNELDDTTAGDYFGLKINSIKINDGEKSATIDASNDIGADMTYQWYVKNACDDNNAYKLITTTNPAWEYSPDGKTITRTHSSPPPQQMPWSVFCVVTCNGASVTSGVVTGIRI